jgi:DNA repair exonuclease SbcCD ATPase subunit
MPRAMDSTPRSARLPTGAMSRAAEAAVERPFRPAELAAVPEPPPAGMLPAVRYAFSVSMARWQRRGAIKALTLEIEREQAQLDELLAILGRKTRELHIDSRALADENAALDQAEKRRAAIEQGRAGLRDRKSAEQQSFAELEAERQGQVTSLEAALERARQEHAGLEAQRKGLRDQHKAVERQQRELAKSAAQRDEQATKATTADVQAGLRRAAETLRSESAALEPERQELELRIAELEPPVAQAVTKIDGLEVELAAARRGLSEARDSHRQHQASLDTDLERSNREQAQIESEIQRRLLSLGTLVNLNRIPHPGLDELYARIDGLRQTIGQRSTEIERLSAERDAYDRGAYTRGMASVGIGATALVLVLIVVLALL